MEKCKECYWKEKGKISEKRWCAFKEKEPDTCKYMQYQCEECEEDEAEYEYKGQKLCSGCLIKTFELQEATTTHYYRDGEWLGSDDDFDEVIENLDEDIKKLEDE